MPQSIFVSYVYEDKRHRDNVAGWFANQAVGPNRVMIAEALDRRQQGEMAIKDYLRPLIRGSAAVLCLVGDNTCNSNWVRYELDVATSLNKKIVLARIPGTTGAAPFGHRHHTIAVLDPSTVIHLL